MTPTVESFSSDIAFDGVNVWVTIYGGSFGTTADIVNRLDGTLVGTVTVGLGPLGIAFDGTQMWVSSYSNETVTKIRAIYKTTLPVLLKDF